MVSSSKPFGKGDRCTMRWPRHSEREHPRRVFVGRSVVKRTEPIVSRNCVGVEGRESSILEAAEKGQLYIM